MDNQQLGVFVSLGGTLVSILASWHAVRQARDARRHQLASEAAYFNFGRLLVKRPWRESDHNQMECLAEPYPLGEFGKVPDDYPAGWPVAMCARNKGKEARQIEVKTKRNFHTDLHPFICGSDGLGHVDEGEELQIVYPYDPARRGRREKVTVSFETVGGEKVTQRFNFIHGLLKVERL